MGKSMGQALGWTRIPIRMVVYRHCCDFVDLPPLPWFMKAKIACQPEESPRKRDQWCTSLELRYKINREILQALWCYNTVTSLLSSLVTTMANSWTQNFDSTLNTFTDHLQSQSLWPFQTSPFFSRHTHSAFLPRNLTHLVRNLVPVQDQLSGPNYPIKPITANLLLPWQLLSKPVSLSLRIFDFFPRACCGKKEIR